MGWESQRLPPSESDSSVEMTGLSPKCASFVLRHKSCTLVPHARVCIPEAWERAEIAQGLGSFWQLKAPRRGLAPGEFILLISLYTCADAHLAHRASLQPRQATHLCGQGLFFLFPYSTCRIYSDLAWSWISPSAAGPKQVLKALCSPVSYQVSAESSTVPQFLLVPARDIGLGSVSSSFNSSFMLAILVVAFKAPWLMDLWETR